VVLGNMPYFTTLWADLLTHGLPHHRLLWQYGPLALFVLGVAVLAATAWRLAGRWAGGTTAVLAGALSTSALLPTLAQAFHGLTWFTSILLGASLAWAAGTRRTLRRRALVLAPVAAIAGVNLASDPLLALAGITPLVAAPALRWVRGRRQDDRDLLALAGATAGAAIAVALVTTGLMHSAGVTDAAPRGFLLRLAGADAVGGRIHTLLADLGALAGSGRSTGALWLPVLCVAAAAAVVGALGRRVRLGRAAGIYVAYWTISAGLLSVAFVASRVPLGQGTASVRYLVGTVYAAAAALPLLAAGSRRGRVLLAGAAVGVCALACVSLARNDLAAARARQPVVQYGSAIVRTLHRLGLRRGYAQYWKAAALSWQSGDRIVVAPVTACLRGRICPFRLNSVASWYAPGRRPARSFLLDDPYTDGFGAGVRSLGRPEQVRRFGPIRLLVYRGDISRRLG
jgi:hypothetical protein